MQKEFNRLQGSSTSQKIGLTHLWLPPYACQQTAVDIYRGAFDENKEDDDPVLRQVQEQILFPLELSLRDYLLRGFDVLDLVLRNNKFGNILAEHPTEHSQDSFSPLNIGENGQPGTLRGKRTSMVKAMIFEECTDKDYATFGNAPLSELLVHLMNVSRPKSGVYYGEELQTDRIFQAAERLSLILRLVVDVTKENLLIPNRLVQIDGFFDDLVLILASYPPEDADLTLLCASALQRLRKQYSAHMKFSDTRVSRLGFEWSKFQEILSEQITKVYQQNEKVASLDDVRITGQMCIDSLEAVLAPDHLSLLQLLTRLLGVYLDLKRFSSASAEVGDYDEATRLTGLSHLPGDVLGSIISDKDDESSGFDVLDGMKELCQDALEAMVQICNREDALHCAGHYATARELQNMTMKLFTLRDQLSKVIDPDLLLLTEQSACPPDIKLTRYAGVDSDFLFHFKYDDGHSVASLCVKANKKTLVKRIQQSWFQRFSVNKASRRASAAALGVSLDLSMFSNSATIKDFTPDKRDEPKSLSSLFAMESPNIFETVETPSFDISQRRALGQIEQRRPFSTDVFSMPVSVPAVIQAANNDRQNHRASVANVRASISATSLQLDLLLLRGKKILEEAEFMRGPNELAHTAFVVRLVTLSLDLKELALFNKGNRHVEEGSRLESMASIVDKTITADEAELIGEVLGEHVLRGRARVDAANELLTSMKSLRSDLSTFKNRPNTIRKPIRSSIVISSPFHDTSSISPVVAPSTDALQSEDSTISSLQFELDTLISLIEPTLVPFALQEQTEYKRFFSQQENTRFVTYSFLYRLQHDSDSQTLCTLSVKAGTECATKVIAEHWSGAIHVPHSSSHYDGDDRLTLAEFKALGFDSSVLRAGGVHDAEIIKAGYAAEELQKAGFDVLALRSSGMDDATIRSVGLQSELDKAALSDLFTNTTGSQWKNNKYWQEYLSAKPGGANTNAVCRMAGTKFSTEGFISAILLPNNNLSGQLSSSLGQASNLTQLVLNSNSLYGALPSSVFRLMNLTILFLDDNDLEGEIPIEIGLLSSIIMIRLDGNRFTGSIPKELCRLSNLKRFSASRNLLTGHLPENIHLLKSCQEFIVNDNQLSGAIPSSVYNAPMMRTLALNDNLFSDFIPIPQSPVFALTHYNIKNNRFSVIDKKYLHKLQKALPKCRITYL